MTSRIPFSEWRAMIERIRELEAELAALKAAAQQESRQP